MDGQLAQLIAFVGHGNSFLSGSVNDSALDLDQSNSAFQFVKALKFARYPDKQASYGIEMADSTQSWFEMLRSEGATRLWYVAFAWKRADLPEHIAGSFSGGIPRAIQADHSDHYELWYPAWTVGDKDEPNRRIWNVEYKALNFDRSQAMTPDVESTRVYLRQKLELAKGFSQRAIQGAYQWEKCFVSALQSLSAEDSQSSYHADMLPLDGYSLPARQLLAAAAQANVFGGMGSWNDIGFDDQSLQAEYEQVTRELYEAVKVSFVVAVNSFDKKLVTLAK